MPTPSRAAILITAVFALFASFVLWYPIDHQAMYIQGFYWKESIDVTSSPVIKGEGSVLPRGAVELSREEKYDKSDCPAREDECVGVKYTWYTYTVSFTETVETISTHGYDQNPIPPSTLFLSDGQAKENSESLYMVVYFVDARGSLFAWDEIKKLEDFQAYDLKSSYVGSYNILGFLLSVH